MEYTLRENYASEFQSRIHCPPDGKTHIYYTGQAGYILKSSSGTTLGIDLYLSDCVSKTDGFKRLMAMVLHPDELEIDYLLSTHRHYDHYDPDSVPSLLAHKKTRLITSSDCKEEVIKSGLQENSKVQYISEGESIFADDIHITAVRCDHGDSAPEAIGLIIILDGIRIYVAGDTCLHLEWADWIRSFGEIDIAILPINGAFGNLNEEDAARYASAIKPGITIPSHYWCFAEHHGDPGKFIDAMKKLAPECDYLLMMQCEEIII